MISIVGSTFYIPVALPEADRDVSPKLRLGLHHARRSAQRITAAAAATSGSGRIHQMWRQIGGSRNPSGLLVSGLIVDQERF
jgi:hypothetical protein